MFASCRTSASPSRTPWPILTWTKDGCATTRACANAVSQLREACASTRQTSSRPPANRSTIYGSENSPRCTKSKVRDILYELGVPFKRTARGKLYLKLLPFCVFQFVFNRGNAQVHRRAAANRPCSVVHKPTECGIQEFRQVSLALAISAPAE